MKITDLAFDHLAFTDPTKIRKVNPWRADLQRARFRKAYFHVDGSGVDNGRRIVMHEFPKKNYPYAEDMGRRAYEFTVRGYCIQYVRNVDPTIVEGSMLYQRDYRVARDLLADELSSGVPGKLFLPTYKGREITVICPRYKMTEEERFGGYVTFDMTFVELGITPTERAPDTRDDLIKQFLTLRERAVEAANTAVAAGSENV
jgi:prophage DNA circulation protein